MNRSMLASAAIAALGMFCAPGAGAATVDVFVFNFGYSVNAPPGVVEDPTIDVGDTVRWVFLQGLHSVHASAGQDEFFESAIFQGNGSQTFEHTFSNVGSFAYFCDIHGDDNGLGGFEGMGAFVHVVPAPASAALFGTLGLAPVRRRRR